MSLFLHLYNPANHSCQWQSFLMYLVNKTSVFSVTLFEHGEQKEGTRTVALGQTISSLYSMFNISPIQTPPEKWIKMCSNQFGIGPSVSTDWLLKHIKKKTKTTQKKTLLVWKIKKVTNCPWYMLILLFIALLFVIKINVYTSFWVLGWHSNMFPCTHIH